MANRRNYTEKKRRRYQSSLGMLMVTIVVVSFALVMAFQMQTLKAQENRYSIQEASLTRQLEEENERSEDLAESKAYVQTRQYIEQMAREKLGLVNPDETVVKARK